MRLINTRTLELEQDFENRIPAYAIFSHTWGDEEVTQAVHRACEAVLVELENIRGARAWFTLGISSFIDLSPRRLRKEKCPT